MTRQHLVKVAVAQIDTQLDDPRGNLERHLEFIARAGERGVQLLVFPETSLTGFPHGSVLDYGISRQGREIQQVAPACGPELTVVVGIVEEAPAAQFFNASVVLSDGEVVHIHRKLNLATYGSLEEGKYFAQGRYVETFDLADAVWRASVLAL